MKQLLSISFCTCRCVCLFLFLIDYRSARQIRREQMKESDLKKKVGQHPLAFSRRLSSGSGTHPTSSESDQYGLSQLFLPDNPPKKESETESAMEGVKLEEDGTTTVKVCVC